MKITHAMILAAGLGTRMRPLTETLPKPLIQVQGKPLIDWCLEVTQAAGVEQVVVNTSYRAQQLEDYLAARQTPRIHVSREEPAPLETGGGIAKALPLLGDAPFLAMNSDAIFPDFSAQSMELIQQAWSDDLDFLLLLVPTRQAIGWEGKGDFLIDAQGRLRRPNADEVADYIFSGIEIIHPRVFAGCPSGAFSLSTLWAARRDAHSGWHARMKGVVYPGAWLNVGDLAGLAASEHYLLTGCQK